MTDVSYWESNNTCYEARVYPGHFANLQKAIDTMVQASLHYNNNTEELTFSIEKDAVVIRFPGGSQSVGWQAE